MHKLILSLILACTFCVSAVAADDAKKAPSAKQQAQRDLMKTCNTKAADKKGDDRKKFMSTCLKGDAAPAPAPQTQQSKMTSCNKDASAKSLKGDDRKKFMSTCLKG